jgi:glycogen synthase
LRICLLSYEFPPSGGGEASYVKALASGLAKDGNDVVVLVPGSEPAGLSAEGFRIVRLGLGRGPIRGAGFLSEAEREITRLAREGAIDVAHVAFDYPTFFVRLRGILPCVATVHHLHKVEALSMLPYESGAVRKCSQILKGSILTFLEGNLARQCGKVIAVSEFTAASVRMHTPVPAERISVVRNGIDVSDYERGDGERFRREFPGLGERMVLYVGRLERSKGLHFLVPAFARACARAGTSTMVIVGRGSPEYVKELKSLAASAGVSDNVVFAGRMPQELLPHAYAASSLVVLPSLMEGFGMTALESMASGKPCVATMVGALPETVRQGETGLLVRPADPKGLGDAMATLLADPGLAREMGRRGLEIAKKDYGIERMTAETLAVYRQAVEGTGIPARAR